MKRTYLLTLKHRLALLMLAALPGAGHAIEEPDYRVITSFSGVEVRHYTPYIVAEVTLQAPAEQAANQAFTILARYIFGKNQQKQTLAMTAPVIQTSIPEGERVQFVLPRGTSMNSAPFPLDARIVLREIPAQHWAVIRYSGTWSRENYETHLKRLRSVLHDAALKPFEPPSWARYNPPFTPWFLRRNEIWLGVRPHHSAPEGRFRDDALHP